MQTFCFFYWRNQFDPEPQKEPFKITAGEFDGSQGGRKGLENKSYKCSVLLRWEENKVPSQNENEAEVKENKALEGFFFTTLNVFMKTEDDP